MHAAPITGSSRRHERRTVPASRADEARRLRICFVMLQALGHVSATANLRSAVTILDRITGHWLETTLSDRHPVLDHVPGLPGYLQAGIRSLVEVRRAVRDFPADVLVFNPQNLAMLCQWQMSRVPTILMTDLTPLQHDAMAAAYGHRSDRNRIIRRCKHEANVWNFRLARSVVAFSSWVRESLVHDYAVAPEKVHVIPPGIDTRRWCPSPSPRPLRRTNILFVGNDFDRKGGGLLLDVFRELSLGEHADLHLVTRAPVGRAPGVFVHHDLPNDGSALLQLYQQADIFVLPTSADGLPNAALEAAAVGLPIVTTQVGGLADVVEDGTSGYLLTPGDGSGLGAALRRLIAEPGLGQTFGGRARDRATRKFDARVNAGRLLDLAEEIARRA